MDVYETPIDSPLGIGDYDDVDDKEIKTLKAQPFKQPSRAPPTVVNYYSKGPSCTIPATSTDNYECPVPTLPRVGCHDFV